MNGVFFLTSSRRRRRRQRCCVKPKKPRECIPLHIVRDRMLLQLKIVPFNVDFFFHFTSTHRQSTTSPASRSSSFSFSTHECFLIDHCPFFHTNNNKKLLYVAFCLAVSLLVSSFPLAEQFVWCMKRGNEEKEILTHLQALLLVISSRKSTVCIISGLGEREQTLFTINFDSFSFPSSLMAPGLNVPLTTFAARRFRLCFSFRKSWIVLLATSGIIFN